MRWLVWLVALELLLLVLGLGLARLRVVAPMVGLGSFALGGVVGALVVVGSLAVLLLRWREQLSLLGVLGVGLVGLVGVALVLGPALSARSLPVTNDVTTAVDDPPQFVALAAEPANAGRDLSFSSRAAELQRGAYEFEPLLLSGTVQQCLSAAVRVASALGWQVVAVDEGRGRLEATDESQLFGFVDDVVVRVRSESDGKCRVDLRSKSRDGKGDLGANARRIRRFAGQLVSGEG